MVITLYNCKALLPLLSLSDSTISKFYQPFTMEFFRIDNPFFYLFFSEIGRNYIMLIKSTIITSVGNIIVLVSQNITCFGYFMPMNHVVSKKAALIFSPPLSLTRISPGLFVVLQEMLYQISFALIKLLQKIMHFHSKKKNSFNLLLIAFEFAVLCMYFCHHETTNSFIFAYIHNFLFGFSSNNVA